MYLFLSYDESIHTYSDNIPIRFNVNLFETLDTRDGVFECGLTECHITCDSSINTQVLINCNIIETSHVYGRYLPTLRHLHLQSPYRSTSESSGNEILHHLTFDKVYYQSVVKGSFKDISIIIDPVQGHSSYNLLSHIKAFTCVLHIRKK